MTDLTSVTELNGHCYCGKVRYTVRFPDDADPKLNFSCYCHCESCRRAHACPLYQVASLDASQFEVAEGADFVNDFQKEGSKVVRAFATCCGTRMYNKFPTFKPGGKEIMVFFPNTLIAEDQKRLPELLKPNRHHEGESCVLDFALLKKVDPGNKGED